MSPSRLIFPTHHYFSPSDIHAGVRENGIFREIHHCGRVGLHATGKDSFLHLHAGHTLDAPRGALTWWVMALEDLRPGIWWGHYQTVEPDFANTPLLSTSPQRREILDCAFSLSWQQFWWRPLMTRFCARHPETHFRWWSHFGPCEFHFPEGKWMQLGLAWDREARTASLYANGVCVSRTDSWKRPIFDVTGPDLYTGSTLFALGELNFYEGAWADADFARAYAADGGEPDESMRVTHAGGGCVEEACPPPDGFVERFFCPLTDPADLEKFYVQGNRGAVSITPQGMRVETPQGSPPLPEEGRDKEDMIQVYMHLWEKFEGELFLEFEFMPLAHEGLGLVMVQGNGMQREDFMRDHPLRTTGSMRMVCWENVRNYHWEFFREMEGMRNDIGSHIFMKNPFFRGLAYQTMPRRLELNTWHRARLRQDGGRWRGYMDGYKVFDVLDDPSAHAGPVYKTGHVSLRNMRNTRMLWRNLRISTRESWQVSK
jgi:hypothetical protein